MCAGVSGKPLASKLGIKPGFVVSVVGRRIGYRRLLGGTPENVVVREGLHGPVDMVHAFVTQRKELEAQFDRWKGAIRPNGWLWISWPKKGSREPTDLSENTVREVALSHGLVDVKVCAVNETWSGLKLVYRLRDRT